MILIYHWKCLRSVPVNARFLCLLAIKSSRSPCIFFCSHNGQLLILFVSWLFCSLDVQVANLHLTCTGRSFLVILAKISRVLCDWSDRFAMTSYSLSFMCHHWKTTLQMETHSKSFMIQDF